MIDNITLEGFKCFCDETVIPLSQITIMYGKNGRGKSSVAQSLLLISQTMIAYNSLGNLLLAGDFVDLGTFDDVKNNISNSDDFKINIRTAFDCVDMSFARYPNKPQLAKLNRFIVNGVDQFDVKSDIKGEKETKSKLPGSTSDVNMLQNLKLIQYVAAGRLGPVNSVPRRDSLTEDWIGVNGENVINVLSNQNSNFIVNVQKALSNVLSGATIKINNEATDRIELFLNSHDGSETFKPVNVGFGYSYVLPVIVAALMAKKESLLIVENPEAHLHPAAQSRLMKFLIETAKEKKLQLIIESHSDHVVNGMRIAMKEGLLSPKDGHIVYFSDEEDDQIQVITSDVNGTLSDYPDDFMDEWTSQMLKLV